MKLKTFDNWVEFAGTLMWEIVKVLRWIVFFPVLILVIISYAICVLTNWLLGKTQRRG